jgi:c(7)-type cytochrome triheme protein
MRYGRVGSIAVAAAALAAVVAAAIGISRLRAAPLIVQPLSFSHAVHIEAEDMECTECHHGAETGVHAGLPDIRECYECHRTAEGDHPDEPKVREYARKKQQIPFVRVNRNAGHVYFSHRVHVSLAQMECEACHGDIAALREPLGAPTPSLHSMDACIACHRKEQASLECVACHK